MHMEFLQHLFENTATAEEFPQGFPCAIHQVLALPLAEPGMSWADTMRSVYTLMAATAEMILIVCSMNLHHGRLLAIMDGVPAAIPIVEVEPEDFDFKGNTHDDA